MAELIWECLSISIVLLFGVNIGLAMGLNQAPKNKILSISLLYGAILFTIGSIAGYISSFYSFTNQYIAVIIGLIGVLTVLIGIYTIVKWRKDRTNHDLLLSKATLSASICCFLGFAFSAILLAKSMESSYTMFNIAMAVALILIVMFCYRFSNFLRHAERPYPVLLGNFMILNGFYFIIAGLFLPTIQSLASVEMSPLVIGTTNSLIFLLMAGGGVLLMGVYLKKEGITSLSDIYPRKASKKIKKN
jgi:predicted transporter